MAAAILPVQDPTYGEINGFTTTDSFGNYGGFATVINARTSDIIQFANVDPTISTTVYHSAVGFPNAGAFPLVPYPFPTSAAQPSAPTIVAGTMWSTGLIASVAPGNPPCLSQSFSVPQAGAYFFGDYTYYNLNNMRDVLIVSP